MAVLFEYAATMGLVDVAYISPIGARDDYSDTWGADDLCYLSRYDGLRYIRVNPVGAWCLGQTEVYEPRAAETIACVFVISVTPSKANQCMNCTV